MQAGETRSEHRWCRKNVGEREFLFRTFLTPGPDGARLPGRLNGGVRLMAEVCHDRPLLTGLHELSRSVPIPPGIGVPGVFQRRHD